MEKKKILIISISAVLALLVGMLTYMGVSGKFSDLKAQFADGDKNSVTEESTQSTVKQAELKAKATMPETPVAVVFDNLKDNAVNSLPDISDYGFNSVIFDYSKETSDLTASLVAKAKDSKLFCGIRVDAKETDSASEFIKTNNLDFVILINIYGETDNFTQEIKKDTDLIKAANSSVLIGFQPNTIKTVTDSVSSCADKGYFDFVFLNQSDQSNDEFSALQNDWYNLFSEVWVCYNLSGLNDFSADNAESLINAVSLHKDDGLCKLLAFSSYSEIASASSVTAQTVKDYILKSETYLLDKGFELSNYSKTTISTDQPSINFRGTSSPLYDLKCNGEKLKTASNGDFSVDCELKPGKNTIKFEHRDKTYTYTVNYNINILKSVSPTKSISVPGNMDMDFTAVALSGSKLTLTFNGKSYTMQQSSSDSDDDLNDSQSNFKTYKATVKTPAGSSSVKNIGTFKVTASYSGMSETMTGANVKINAEQSVTVAEVRTTSTNTRRSESTASTAAVTTQNDSTTGSDSSTTVDKLNSTRVPHGGSTTAAETTVGLSEDTATTSSEKLQQYSYSEDYGLGKTTYIEITDDYVETYPGSNLSTVSVPDCSPFLKGTVDYFSKSATIDSDTYYYVGSGYKIPLSRKENAVGGKATIKHLKVVEGYIMPSNSLHILSCSESGGDTTIKIATNRKIAFNAKLLGQSYSDNGSGRMVKVTSVNCTGLKFSFYDTTNITGSLKFNSSIISNGSTKVSGSITTLTLNFLNSGNFYGFHYEYDSDGNLLITVKNKPSSLSGYTVMLDPGHGGYDGGASCVVSSGTWSESKINLALAQKIKELLENEGARVIMTRTDDTFLSLTGRNESVRKYQPDLFISIHCDASAASSGAYGTSAYYYRAYSQPLAKYIHQALVSAYKNQIYAGSSRDSSDRGSLFGAYRVARVEECPAILVEYGFVTNTVECQALENAGNRAALASATVTGIKNYIANS